MKTTKKQMANKALQDMDKAATTFRLLKDKLQLDSDQMTDKTVFCLIAQKTQIMHLTSIIDDYLDRVRNNIVECTK